MAHQFMHNGKPLSPSNYPMQPGWSSTRNKPRNCAQNFLTTPEGVLVETRAKVSEEEPEDDPERFTTTAKFFEQPKEAETAFKPRFVALDKKVLRVKGFYRESVSESKVEIARTRKIEILFYLEDETIEVVEPKVINSGLPQGTFLKRHRVAKADGSFVTWEDILPGKEIALYGRVFSIVDCDGYTKEYFAENGVEVDASGSYPPNNLLAPPPPKVEETAAITMTQFAEAELGKHQHDSKAMKQFLDHGGQSLRFQIAWDNSKAMYGDLMVYSLEYYLEDDTVQIIEITERNSGRDGFPVFYKRAKLPKQWLAEVEFPRRQGREMMQDPYYLWTDLVIGQNINVYGRDMLVVACDSSTRKFLTARGIEVKADMKMKKDDDKSVEPLEIPPYNGFGSEEDSLNSTKRLVPKPLRKDFKKFMNNDGNVLRFKANIVSSFPEDRDRKFIIAFFLADDTQSIFEPPQRNSGIVGGKFLERGKYKNAETGKYFTPSDLEVGKVVRFNAFRFEIVHADEYTMQYKAM